MVRCASLVALLLVSCAAYAHPSALLRREMGPVLAMLNATSEAPRCTAVRVPQGVLTAAHCVLLSESRTRFEREDGAIRYARLIRYETETDLALYTDPFRPDPMAYVRHAGPELDEPITAIGMPSGVRFVVHRGRVTSRARPGGFALIRAGIVPGFSGGPVYDRHGEIVGIVSRRIVEWGWAPRASEELGQITPCDAIRRFLRS